MEHYLEKENIKEKVKPENWVWGVVYKDETELHQFSNDGQFHLLDEIQWDKVKMFTMYKYENMSKRIDIVVTPEMKLFHFYRNVKPYYLENFVRVIVFGWKVKETNQSVYNFILPDDRVITSNIDSVDLTLFDLKN